MDLETKLTINEGLAEFDEVISAQNAKIAQLEQKIEALSAELKEVEKKIPGWIQITR